MLSIVFGIILSIFVIVTCLRSRPAGVLLLISLYPILPRYLGIPIGDEALALTFRRILTTLIVIICFRELLKIFFAEKFGKFHFAIYLYLIYVIIGFTGGVLSGDVNAAIFRAIDNVFVLLLGALGSTICVERFGWKTVIICVFIAPLSFIAPLTILEYTIGKSYFFDWTANTGAANAIETFSYIMREDTLRSQATFDGPLMLAEYTCFSIAACLFIFRYNKKIKWLLIIPACLFIIYATFSRSSLIIAPVILLTSFLVIFVGKFKIDQRYSSATVYGLGIMYITYFFLDLYSSAGYISDFTYFTSESDRSTYSRSIQFDLIWPYLENNIFFGIGFRRNFVENLSLHAFDNFYLWTLLESGIIGIICIMLIIGLSVKSAFSNKNDNEIKNNLQRFTLDVIFIYLAHKFFVQSSTNFIFFILIIFGILNLKNNAKSLNNLGNLHARPN